jgi:hypothetical protein
MQAVDRILLFTLGFLSLLAITPLWADSSDRTADATIVYLIQGSPPTATNVINTDHTITATATESVSGTPVVGFDVTFEVLTGPNAGTPPGAGVTDSNGQATFTYTGSGGAGDDSIEICLFFAPPARTGRPQVGQIPPLDCDTVTKTWISPTPTASPTTTAAPTSTVVAATTTPTPTAIPSPTTTPAQLPGTGSGGGGSSVPWVVLGIASFAALALLAGTTGLKRVR